MTYRLTPYTRRKTLTALCALMAIRQPALVQTATTVSAILPSKHNGWRTLKPDVNWSAFLARHDLIWHVAPTQWNEGFFLGNGQLGLMGYVDPEQNALVFHLGRMDVTDHRKAPKRKTSRGVSGAEVMFDFPRLDIGRLALRPSGRIRSAKFRLDLHQAELRGTLETSQGRIEIRALTLRNRMAHRLDLTSTERDEQNQPARWAWEIWPGDPASPRAQVFPPPASYQTNPPSQRSRLRDVNILTQPLLAGGDFATAWQETVLDSGNRSTLFVSTINLVPASGASGPQAATTVETAIREAVIDLKSHRQWWDDYYRQSFLTIPDLRMESFYWIQMYKLAAASRPDGPAIDVLGPFFRISQWPGLWWNLNVQLTYSPVYTSNRLSMGESLVREIDSHFDELFSMFRGKSNIGDFAWVLHNYWSQYRYAGDSQALTRDWLPKARAVLEDYIQRLRPGADDGLILPEGQSPEYEGFKAYRNSSYNAALLRWLLKAALSLVDSQSSEAQMWRSLQARLAPLPTDASGIQIADGVPLSKSHRHYSHLLGLHPLHVFDISEPDTRKQVETSLTHWLSLEDGKALAGYSYTGAASMYATLGRGETALYWLNHFLNGFAGISRLLPNTFYVESEGRNPVIETPLAAATSIMELLLQSWGETVRVFPAVPSHWRDAQFFRLRAEGGFLVSALRRNGQTAWVVVESQAGSPLAVKVPDWHDPPSAISQDGKPLKLSRLAADTYAVALEKGDVAFLSTENKAFHIRPLNVSGPSNYWGLDASRRLGPDQSWPQRMMSET